MESKACLTFSVVGGSHFPAHVFKVAFRFFFVRTVLIQDPAHINNFTFPAMASNRLLVCLVRMFARARASKVMVPKWGQSQLGFRALTDEPLLDAHQKQSLAPCSGPGRWSEISQTSTVSADITYDTALALPVTAG